MRQKTNRGWLGFRRSVRALRNKSFSPFHRGLLCFEPLEDRAMLDITGLTGIDIGPDPGTNPLPGDGFEDGDQWVMRGGGIIWGMVDGCHFEYQSWSGDFDAKVRVIIQGPTNSWAKAGIMARADLTPGATNATAIATPGAGSGILQFRGAANGGTNRIGGGGPNTTSDGSEAVWLRLLRQGNSFYSSWALDVDGQPGSWWFEVHRYSANFPQTLHVGLSVDANNAGLTSECRFDQFSIEPFTSLPDGSGVSAIDVPGPDGGAGFFGIREVIDAGNVNSMNVATSALVSASGTIVDHTGPVVNFQDGLPQGRFTDSLPFEVVNQSLVPPGAVQRFAMAAKGDVLIPAAGDYSFGVNSSDGFRLAIDGTYVGGYELWRNPTDTLMTTHLSAGLHSLLLTFFTTTHDPTVELFASLGMKTEFDDDFQLVGDTENGGLMLLGPQTAPPTADAGGPYDVLEGQTVELDASGSSDPDQPAELLDYVWDLDGDGVFGEVGAEAVRGDEIGIRPVFVATDLDGPDNFDVVVRVTDVAGATGEDSETINVANAAPTVEIVGPGSVLIHRLVSLSGVIHDTCDADTHMIEWDFGDGSPPVAGSLTPTHYYTRHGSYEVTATVRDDDGDVNTTRMSILVLLGEPSTLDLFPDEKFAIDQQSVSFSELADFDRDGHLDVVYSGSVVSEPESMFIRLGRGDGTFLEPETLRVGSSDSSLWCPFVADLNGDDKLDLAYFVDEGVDNRFWAILLGDGAGGFAAALKSEAQFVPAECALGDVDGDGDLDLVEEVPDSSPALLLGNGDGTFGDETLLDVSPTLLKVALADFNGDGDLDLVTVTADSAPRAVKIHLGNGDGTFGQAVLVPIAQSVNPYYFDTGDLNRDGMVDLVVGTPGSAILVLHGRGNATFEDASAYMPTDWPYSQITDVWVENLDGDDYPDILAADPINYTLHFASNLGDGTFGEVSETPAGYLGGQGPAVGDIDEDGHRDLVFSAWNTGLEIVFGQEEGFVFEHFFVNWRGGYPGKIFLLDVNNDGQTDVVSKDHSQYHTYISVFLKDAGGTFSLVRPRKDDLVGPGDIAAGDFNGDGNTDFAAIVGYSIRLVLGQGDGTFVEESTFYMGTEFKAIVAADFDDDGDLDLATTENSGTLSVMSGRGDGTFEPPVAYPIIEGAALAETADLNDDTITDIVVLGNGIGVDVLLGAGDGTFSPTPTQQIAGSSSTHAYSLALGDLNQDGHTDLATAIDKNNDEDFVAVLLGNGDGTFDGQKNVPSARKPRSVRIADLNADGIADMVVGRKGWTAVFAGIGGGDFAEPGYFAEGANDVAIADMNGDAFPDLITAHGSAGIFGHVSLLRQNYNVLWHVPNDTNPGPVDAVQLHFRTERDTTSLSLAEDLAEFIGPEGAIAADGFSWIDPKTLEISFAPQTVPGEYELVLGPEILDSGGNAMDVDGDSVSGETPDDQYRAAFTIKAPSICEHEPTGTLAPPVELVRLSFDHVMDVDSFTLDDIQSFNGPDGPASVTGFRWVDPQTLEISIDVQQTGDYEMVLSSDILDLAGNPLDQDGDFVPGEAADDVHIVSFGVDAPRITSHAPAGATADAVENVRLFFNRMMDTSSFTLEDVADFYGPRGAIQPSGYAWIDSQTLEISFPRQTTTGAYELVLGPQVLDTNGNALDQDSDLVPGELSDDYYPAGFVISSPRIVWHSPFRNQLDAVDIVSLQFDRAMNRDTFSLEDIVQFDGPNGSVDPTGFNWLDDLTVDVICAPITAPGVYELVLGPHVRDHNGNALDQDGDGVAEEALDDRYVARFGIHVPTIVRTEPVSAVAIMDRLRLSFSEPMDSTSFSIADDIVEISGPDRPFYPTGFQWLDPQTLEVYFEPQTEAGKYTVVFGPDIFDLSGNALDRDGDLILGEVGDDHCTASLSLGISSAIEVDTTWRSDDRVIVVDKLVSVLAGVTLTIEPGMVVKFAGSAGIEVAGTLRVMGAAAEPVVLTSLRDDSVGGDTNQDGSETGPAPGNWRGIEVLGTGRIKMEHFQLQYATDSINADHNGAQVKLSEGVLRNGSGTGIYVYQPFAEVTAESCVIADHGYTGVFVRADSRHVFRNCTIVGNGFGGTGWEGAGIHLGGANLTLDNCIVSHNKVGLHHSGDPPLVTIRNSVFHSFGQEIEWDGDPGEPDLGRDGNQVADPLFVDRTRGDFRLAAGSPAIDAGRGIEAPHLDLLGQPRYDDVGMPNRGTHYPAYVDIGAFERQENTHAADLAVVNVSNPHPDAVSPGQNVSFQYTVQNVGLSEFLAGWRDIVYLSDDPYLGDDLLLATFDHAGPLAASEDYVQTVDATVPDTSGPKYVLIHTNALRASSDTVETNNVGVADSVLAVDVPTLKIGVPVAGTTSFREWRYYRFEGEPGRTVILSLSDYNVALDLFVRRELPPTVSHFDVVGQLDRTADRVDARILSPEDATYYVGVVPLKSTSGVVPSYTLTAELASLDVREIVPDEIGNGGPATIKIVGDAFEAGDGVILHASSGETWDAVVSYQGPSTLFATFHLSGPAAFPGVYDVEVVHADQQTVTEDDAITVTGRTTSDFQAWINVQGASRPGRVIPVQVGYWNSGNVDLAAPMLHLDSGGEVVEWKLPGSDVWIAGSDLYLHDLSPDGPAGVLRPGQTETIDLKARLAFRGGPYRIAVLSRELPLIQWTADPGNLDQLEGNIRPNPTRIYSLRGEGDVYLDELLGLPTGIVAGQVIDEQSGLPVPGVVVGVGEPDSREYVQNTTDEQGRFILYGVRPGIGQPHVQHHLVMSPQTIDYPEGDDVLQADIQVDPAGQVVGKVVYSRNWLVPNRASVTIRSTTSDFTETTFADEVGRYQFGELPEGIYAISCSAAGDATHVTRELSVAAPSKTVLDIFLEPEARIVGRVILESGNPQEAALWGHAREIGQDAGSVFSQRFSSSMFVIDRLPPGTYNVTLGGEGYETVVYGTVRVIAGEHEDIGSIDLVRSPSGEVRGTVISSHPEYPADEAVIGVFDGETLVTATLAESDGSFQVDGLFEGTYEVRPVGADLALSQSRYVTLRAGETLDGLDLVVAEGGTIVGSVYESNSGQPLAGVKVVVRNTSSGVQSTLTDTTGGYRIEGLGVDTYSLYLPVTGPNATTTVSVQAVDGQEYLADDLSLGAAATLSGRLLDSAGQPVAAGFVYLVQSDRVITSAKIDEQGRYAFGLVQGGTFDLYAGADGISFSPHMNLAVQKGEHVEHDLTAGTASLSVSVIPVSGNVDSIALLLWRQTALGQQLVTILSPDASEGVFFDQLSPGTYRLEARGIEGEGATATIEIAPSAAESLDLTLGVLGRLSGTVSDSFSAPIADAYVLLQSTDDPDVFFVTTTKPDGSYEIPDVPFGELELTVIAEGYEASRETTITVDGETSANVDLTASQTEVRGRIVDPDGRAIPFATVRVETADGSVVGYGATDGGGEFVLTTVSGEEMTVHTSAVGCIGVTQTGLSISPGAIVLLGDFVCRQTAFEIAANNGQAMMAPMSQTPSRLRASTHWIDALWSDFERDPDHVTLGQLPTLPEGCSCSSLHLLRAIRDQDNYYEDAYERAEEVDDLLPWTLGMYLLEFAEAAGTIASMWLLGLQLRAALFAVEASGAAATLGPGLLKGVHDGLQLAGAGIGAVRSSINAAGRAPTAETVKARLADAYDATLGFSSSAHSVADMFYTLAGNAPKELGVAGLLLGVANAANALTKLCSKGPFPETRDSIQIIIQSHNDFERSALLYSRAVASAQLEVQRYEGCTAECDDEEEEDDDEGSRVTSFTPEDKFGPSGYDSPETPVGSEVRFIPAGQSLNYRIEFWNKEDAPVPTQDALVEDTLDPNIFDLSTLEFTRFGFLKWDVKVPGGQSIDARIDCRPEMNIAVDVSADFDYETGTIRWRFHCVDPMTGDYPEDIDAGFLPPYDPETGFEIGWVDFRVEHQPVLPSGTQIANQAFVEFDFVGDLYDHPAPRDGPWINTIDAGTPDSQVVALPPEPAGRMFLVEWSGQDDAGGSGIHSYDVHVSDDGGYFELWLDDTSAMSAEFTGQWLHTYAFYSVAVDNVGHQEPPPPQPDAVTTVSFPYVVVEPTAGLVTAEGGGTAEFSMFLASQPADTLKVAIASSDEEEGMPSVTELTFTTENWDTPQTVTITGKPDGVADGDKAYSIVIGPVTGNDPDYTALDPAEVAVMNFDEDTRRIIVADINQLGAVDAFEVTFSDPMAVAPMIADRSITSAVSLVNLRTGPVAVSGDHFSYEEASQILTWSVNEPQPVGYYELRLDGSLLGDAAGNLLVGGIGGMRFHSPDFAGAVNLQAGGAAIQVANYSVPILSDWNSDGLVDLVVGEKTGEGEGKVLVYVNSGTATASVFDAYEYAQAGGGDLAVPASGCLGAFPVVFDWDGDGRKDLLVGRADGRVQFFPNVNTGQDPQFGTGSFLQYGDPGAKQEIDVGARATVAVVDWNNNGRYDLVMGAMDGRVRVYLDEATSGPVDFRQEMLVLDDTGELLAPSGRSSVAVADLNSDGRKDLVIGNTEGQLIYYPNVGLDVAPAFGGATLIEAGGAPVDLPGTPRSRPFVGDFNADGALDILVGAEDGLIRLYLGHPTPSTDSGTYVVEGEAGGDYSYIFFVPPPLQVADLTPSPSGFVARFSEPIDPSVLNLYDTESGTLGPVDVTVVGDSVGTIAGSVVVAASELTFVATEDTLPADTYTVTLRSAANGFKSEGDGRQLDGDGDGVAGGDYVATFTVSDSGQPVVSLPDFTRGPGQAVDVPATNTGLPVSLSEAAGAESVGVTIEYDPTKLIITDVSVGPTMPLGSSVVANLSVPGRLDFVFDGGAVLPAGPAEFAILTAEVQVGATYGGAHVLDIISVSINGGAIGSTADDAIHVVACSGDSTGNGTYSGLDAQRVARVGVGLDDGFTAYPCIDPVVVADVTGNGTLSGLDAQRIAQYAVGLGPDEIPPIPQPLRLDLTGSRSRQTLESIAPDSQRRTTLDPQDAPAPNAPNTSEFSYEQLVPVVEAAMARIKSTASVDANELLENITFEIANLPNNLLGLAAGQTIKIDADAAGFGWFVDQTPCDNVEFIPVSLANNDLVLLPSNPAQDQVDLLTVILHELGHVLGYDHEDEGLMDDTLPLGTRRLPGEALFDLDQDIFGQLDDLDNAIEQAEADPDAIDKVFASLG